jgi:endonuclease/exonuclease/phosphatase family metal-dependent hydrolase
MSPARRLAVLAAGLLCAATWAAPRCHATITVATFNIEFFPKRDVDVDQVAERLAQTDADLLALQEIRDADALAELVDAAAALTGRDYRAVLSRCLGHDKYMTPAIVYDADRLRLLETRDYPQLQPDGEGACKGPDMPGLLAVFEDRRGERIAALSVHLRPFPHGHARRIEQLHSIVEIVADVERKFGARVITLGDFNTTGFRGHPAEERETVQRLVGAAGLSLPTAALPCTEYYRPDETGPFLPSVLDHILLREGDWDPPEVMGMCAELSCAVVEGRMHPDYTTVSDHCPVRIHGRW